MKWIARTNEANYVAITGEQTGCWSWVGTLNNGRQELNLQPGNPGCVNISPGTAEHEMLHALGTFHEQSRPDRFENNSLLSLTVRIELNSFIRDQYVKIHSANIQSGKEGNFDKKTSSQVLIHGAYDYGSVMHYGRCAFTSNNMETITLVVCKTILSNNLVYNPL